MAHSSFGGEDDLHLSSSLFPRLEAQLMESEKGVTSSIIRFCPERAEMEYSIMDRAKSLAEVRRIHGFHVVCPLVCLPMELLVEQILVRLCPVSLCRVTMTCSYLYMLGSDNRLWRDLYEKWERKWEIVSRKVRSFGFYFSDRQISLFTSSDGEESDGESLNSSDDLVSDGSESDKEYEEEMELRSEGDEEADEASMDADYSKSSDTIGKSGRSTQPAKPSKSKLSPLARRKKRGSPVAKKAKTAFISSGPAAPTSAGSVGKTTSLTFLTASSSHIPLARRNVTIQELPQMKSPPHRDSMIERKESDGERMERERILLEMEREWRRIKNRIARSEARGEKANAFYWKHCFREMEIKALNSKKKPVSLPKRESLISILERPGTNLNFQAAVFPLPLRWYLTHESKSKAPVVIASARRKGSSVAANHSFVRIVERVISHSKRLFSLPYSDSVFDDMRAKEGNLPPNEEWLSFGRMRELRGGDSLLDVLFSVKCDDKDITTKQAMTLNFIKSIRAILGGEIEGLWTDIDFGFGGGDAHRLVALSGPGQKGLVLQWVWEKDSNLLQPGYLA